MSRCCMLRLRKIAVGGELPNAEPQRRRMRRVEAVGLPASCSRRSQWCSSLNRLRFIVRLQWSDGFYPILEEFSGAQVTVNAHNNAVNYKMPKKGTAATRALQAISLKNLRA